MMMDRRRFILASLLTHLIALAALIFTSDSKSKHEPVRIELVVAPAMERLPARADSPEAATLNPTLEPAVAKDAAMAVPALIMSEETAPPPAPEKFAEEKNTTVDIGVDDETANHTQSEAANMDLSGGDSGEARAAYTAYSIKIRQHLESFKRYPRRARLQEIQGQVTIGFVIRKSGRLMRRWIEISSGHAVLDDAALKAVEHAQPFPMIPEAWAVETVSFSVPFGFWLNDPE